MRKNPLKWYMIGSVCGALMLIAGILLAIFTDAGVVSFVLIGIGAGSFTGGFCGFISTRMMEKDAELARKINIEMADERNIMVELKAKAGAHDFISWVLWPVVILFAALQFELWAVLLLVGVQIMRVIVMFCLMRRYRRIM